MTRTDLKSWLYGALIASFLSLTAPGCAAALIGKALDKDQTLTAEQIKAYNDVGSAVYGCFQIGGPPPAGNTVWIVAPKGVTMTFKFGDNCHVLQ
jgi:hypothetical protein